MKYIVTYIVNSDYCSLKPSDPECQRVVNVEANSKTEAVMQLHEGRGMLRDNSQRCQHGKIMPEIWSVEEV